MLPHGFKEVVKVQLHVAAANKFQRIDILHIYIHVPHKNLFKQEISGILRNHFQNTTYKSVTGHSYRLIFFGTDFFLTNIL